MKRVILGLFFVCVMFASTQANEIINRVQVDSIFGEKVVLCEIDFLPDSYILSGQAKTVLDDVVAQLENIDTETMSIRIEGFRGVQDTVAESTRLSMNRALAVEDYFRIQHKVNFERFLTGHKDHGPDCCVEISIYNSPWQTDPTQVQVATKDDSDGPS